MMSALFTVFGAWFLILIDFEQNLRSLLGPNVDFSPTPSHPGGTSWAFWGPKLDSRLTLRLTFSGWMSGGRETATKLNVHLFRTRFSNLTTKADLPTPSFPMTTMLHSISNPKSFCFSNYSLHPILHHPSHLAPGFWAFENVQDWMQTVLNWS